MEAAKPAVGDVMEDVIPLMEDTCVLRVSATVSLGPRCITLSRLNYGICRDARPAA